MKYITTELTNWAIKKIETEYPEDIALLIGHEHWKIAPDGTDVAFNFFIPSTERGYNLSQTFIIDDIGYDLFPMSWERVTGLANLNSHLTTCLADGILLYAKSKEEEERFQNLKILLRKNLSDRNLTYTRGLERINTAMELYQNMLFENSLSQVRMASGFVAGYLSEAIALVNGRYFKRGQEEQFETLRALPDLPINFLTFYKNIVQGATIEELKTSCYEMLAVTRDFFFSKKEKVERGIKNHNFNDLAAWYQELIYWFRRIYYFTSLSDSTKSFVWGCNLQRELDIVTTDFGLKPMDLMGSYRSDDLAPFAKQAKEIEQYIVSEIEMHGVEIQKFNNLSDFLRKNGK